MAIKQVIKYKSDSKYFAGFLQSMIKESGIVGSISQADDSIVMRLDDSNQKAIADFSQLSNKYLAHSLFLGDIQTIEVDSESLESDFKSPTYNISACPRCLERLTDPASEDYLNDSLKCTHYSNEANQEFLDSKYYSPHYSQGSDLLIVDPNSVNRLFVMTAEEIKALFSIEKPTLKVTIKDEVLRDLTGKNFINIKSPYSVKSNLVALNARESEVEYLFFESSDDLKVVVVQDNITVIRDARGVTKELKELDADKEINRFLNIAQEADFLKGSIAANLSTRDGISFIVSNETGHKKVINFQSFILKDVLEQMSDDENKSKLLANFEKKFPSIMQELHQNDEYRMFETVASILELKEKNFESVSDKSLEFHGNGGLKIDTNYGDDGFDYVSFIGSIMSFKLADTDEHYLAYSIFEALGDMAISTLGQLKTKFKIDKFVMMGDMFENTVLYSRILSKFQLNNPYFSKGFALDD
ncbi:hydrogenase [Sulfurimonas sp.]|uniref:hydrogenase n=1 Tax=Sulfurimonas sp. TaxID=2022749 RepID=UPI003564CDD7